MDSSLVSPLSVQAPKHQVIDFGDVVVRNARDDVGEPSMRLLELAVCVASMRAFQELFPGFMQRIG